MFLSTIYELMTVRFCEGIFLGLHVCFSAVLRLFLSIDSYHDLVTENKFELLKDQRSNHRQDYFILSGYSQVKIPASI